MNSMTKNLLRAADNFAIRLMRDLVTPAFVLDAQRRVIIWNRACERLTGVLATDVLGTREHWRAFYDAPRYCLADILALGQNTVPDNFYVDVVIPNDRSLGFHAENWCIMPRVGKRLYLMIDAGPIYDDDGNLVAVVETLRDMTEHMLEHFALESLTIKDCLTGIANRRSFDDKLSVEWARALGEQTPISLLIADIDYFKHYNDTYGHQKGDECLKTVAGAIAAEACRPADLAARYGGEEFAVIMPNTDLDGGKYVAERIRSAISALNIQNAGSRIGQIITLSVGVASTIPVKYGYGYSDLLNFADQSLYLAKSRGRNQIAGMDELPLAMPPSALKSPTG